MGDSSKKKKPPEPVSVPADEIPSPRSSQDLAKEFCEAIGGGWVIEQDDQASRARPLPNPTPKQEAKS